MARLSSNDLVALLRIVHDAYAVSDTRAWRAGLAASLRSALGADNTTYSEIDPERLIAADVMDPQEVFTPAAAAVFERHLHEHPLIAHYARTGDGRARKISDFLTRRELRRLALYNEYVRPFFGTEHQMAIAVSAAASRVVGIALARSGRDFSERERLFLDLLRPHLVQALRTMEALRRAERQVASLTRGVDAFGLALVAVDGAGRPHLLTTQARRWLQAYFGRMRPADRLPDGLRRWMRAQQQAGTHHGDAPPVREPLIVERAGARLIVRHLLAEDGSLLLLEERRGAAGSDALRRLGLTAREAEVLMWVAAGKTNAEAATIVGGRARTVDKHLERIYRKLGVENRTAAASLAHALQAKPLD